MPFADRTWIVSTDHTAGNSTQSILAITLGGLIITALVAIALAQMRRRELYASEMVEERTDELNTANARLTESARFFELSRDLVCTAGFDGKLITVNDAWTELLGWTRDELIEMTLWEACHPDDATAVADSFGDLMRGGSIVDFSFRLPAKDGSWRWLEWSVNGVPERGLIYASARDVTERHRLEEQLWIEHAQMKSAQELASLGSWNVDLESGEMQWSDNLFELLGIERPDEPLTIEHWLAILPDADHDRAMKLLIDTLRDGGEFEFEFNRRQADAHGRPVHLLTRGFAERNAQGRTVRLIGTVADITERHLYEEGLRFVADHDPMTGIANRRQFDSVLKRHVIAARRYGPDGAVLMIDIDDLKQVNDTIGHAAGDELIRSVADALNNRLRGTDLCARIGGDEFAVLLPRATHAEAETTARSLYEALSVPSAELLEKGVKTVTASIGIVMVVDAPGADADELVDLADEAMYQAKRMMTSSIRTYKPTGEQATSAA
ncbi:MAG: diguanylate cyclase [Thermoleophilia bacterium]|nr:diguanylate cyclase [Thermoleophilia bacterium]